MHIVYDARVMAEASSGLGGFTGELLFSLLDLSHGAGVEYTVIIWEKMRSDNYYYMRLMQYREQGRCRIEVVSCRPISLTQHALMAGVVGRIGGDIYFYPHFDLPIGVSLPCIAVVHDLAILKIDGYITDHSWVKTAYFRLMLHLMVRKARFVFAVSETTRRDFLEEVGKGFSNKVGVSLEAPIVRTLLSEGNPVFPFVVPEQFLLYVGVRRPHKNLRRVIDLFVLLKERASYTGVLVLAGSTTNHGFDVERYIGQRSDILIAGQVDDRTLAALYQRTDALVLLSKYEGFGLPAVEAGLYRKKIIISDGGSLPEVAPPWAFVLPNAMDLTQIVFQVSAYLAEALVFDDDYAEKFTWPAVAERVLNQFLALEIQN